MLFSEDLTALCQFSAYDNDKLQQNKRGKIVILNVELSICIIYHQKKSDKKRKITTKNTKKKERSSVNMPT